MATALSIILAAYVALMYGLALWAKRKIHNADDFLVAGRIAPAGRSISFALF